MCDNHTIRSNMQNTLYIYSASAGSGKTTTIARKYIELALRAPGNYRHIQAVTFTNKATEEMKERILGDLARLAHNEPRDANEATYWDAELCPALGKQVDRAELQRRAAACLRGMLLNYGNFRISTIDSFFQEVLRSFARDLNLSGGFRVELDSQSALETACQAVLVDEQYKSESPVMQWITALSLDNADKSRSSRPMAKYKELAQELLKDEVRASYGRYDENGRSSSLPSITEVQTMYHNLSNRLSEIDQQAKAIALEALRLVRPALEAGLDLSYGESGGLGILYKILKGEIKVSAVSKPEALRPARFRTALEKPETLFASNVKAKAQGYVDLDTIASVLESYNRLVEDFLSWGLTTSAIVKHLPAFGLLSAIDSKLKAEQQSNNYILIADTPSLVHELLQDDSGVPFLYERIGSEIKHHMIDEFQDTSKAQFANFLPLIDNSLAEGGEDPQNCFIVGDVKQSIYRWRGSDSTLLGALARKGQSDMRSSSELSKQTESWYIQSESMTNNWRSDQNIVKFNNTLYPLLAKYLDDTYARFISDLNLPEERKAKLEPWRGIFTSNYKDTAQIPKHSHEGYVCVHHFAEASTRVLDIHDMEHSAALEDEDEATPSAAYPREAQLSYQLPEQIRLLKKRGYSLGDIAILVRKNKEASFVAQILMQAEQADNEEGAFAFISDDALAPTEALSVAFTMATLSYIIKPEDKECLLNLQSLYRQLIHDEISAEELVALTCTGRKSLYETLEEIIVRYKAYYPTNEYPHVIKLLDTALTFQQDLSLDIADFIDMWADKGSSLRIPMGQDDEKITIMTVHKAKGLDFKVVLLPFLSWELYPEHSKAPFLWCDNPLSEYAQMPKLPIKWSKDLLHTHFAPECLSEYIQTSIDALNLLYVATTRARHEMHLWIADPQYSKPSKKDKNDVPAKIMELLQLFLGRSADDSTPPGENLRDKYHDYADPEQDKRLGSYKAKVESKPSADKALMQLSELNSYHLGKRVEELKDGILHFTEERRLHFGNLMHSVLSHLEHRDDKEMALQLAMTRGELAPEELEAARERLETLLSCPEAQAWFDGSGTVITERPILGSTPRSRPDRVISYGHRELAVVVDYKFGKRRKAHQEQVERYAQLLKNMGYQRVEGYLWYLSGAEAEEQAHQPSLELGCPSPIRICQL
ncbi:MAG: UvrD-helicase domain-containing protein [Porphyromonas sp.]|nr:UvrD-helicase domain-containing protein [Porphyromonas sp.]